MVLVLGVVWYSFPDTFRTRNNEPVAVTKAEPKVTPNPDQEKLTARYIQRHEDTGESFRCEKRNSAGVLRELEIAYADNTRGVRYYDEAGQLKRITRSTESGSMLSSDVGSDGSVDSFEEKDKQGTVIARYRRQKKKDGYSDLLFKLYRPDGTLSCEYDVIKDEPIWRTYHADGKTVWLETDCSPTRQWLRIYRPDGKLHFEQKLVDPQKVRYGAIVTHTGVIYDASGKATEQLISTEGPYSNWGMSVTKVQFLNSADGSVAREESPTRQGTGYRSPLTNKLYQDFVDQVHAAHEVRHKGHWGGSEKQTTLKDVLRD